MYQRISELCMQKNVNITQMCKDAGISRTVMSELKSGRTQTLSQKNLSALADYFGVSTEYIVNGKEKDVDDIVKFALFEGSEGITDEMMEEVKQFAKFLKERNSKR